MGFPAPAGNLGYRYHAQRVFIPDDVIGIVTSLPLLSLLKIPHTCALPFSSSSSWSQHHAAPSLPHHGSLSSKAIQKFSGQNFYYQSWRWEPSRQMSESHSPQPGLFFFAGHMYCDYGYQFIPWLGTIIKPQ